jgi:transcriptional regulator with XRE-family HTH domain
MITISSDRHLGPLVRRLRLDAGLSQTALGKRVHMSKGGISKRELEARAMTVGALIESGRAFGFDLALVPARHRGVRPTGTGWPA